MKRSIIIIICAICWMAAGANTYKQLSERAERSFKWEEWSSAAAMYELMLKQQPEQSDTYIHAIVACQMIPDSLAAIDLVERAMSHDVGLAEMLKGVKTLDFSLGRGDNYGRFLYQLRNAMPWMSRGLDNELLDYYLFRDDGAMIEKYSKIMLSGLPDSVEYLSSLAHGYVLQSKLSEANTTWQKIISIQPDNYEALLWLGNYMLMNGDKAKAIEYLSRAQAIHPTPYVARLIQSSNS